MILFLIYLIVLIPGYILVGGLFAGSLYYVSNIYDNKPFKGINLEKDKLSLGFSGLLWPVSLFSCLLLVVVTIFVISIRHLSFFMFHLTEKMIRISKGK